MGHAERRGALARAGPPGLVVSEPGGRGVRVLERAQWLPLDLAEAFEFFSDALNLEAITPAWLRFSVVAPPDRMAPGARIDYSLRLHGVPVRWRTRIEVWEPPRRFVDVQLEGPYRLWEHTHRFDTEDGGTTIRDRVRYALPFGPLGSLAHAAFVRRDLERIFDHRREAVTGLLT